MNGGMDTRRGFLEKIFGAGSLALAGGLSAIPNTAEAQTVPETREAEKANVINTVKEIVADLQPIVAGWEKSDIAVLMNKRLTELTADAQRTEGLKEWTTDRGSDGLVRPELFALRRNLEQFEREMEAVTVIAQRFAPTYKKLQEANIKIAKYKF